MAGLWATVGEGGLVPLCCSFKQARKERSRLRKEEVKRENGNVDQKDAGFTRPASEGGVYVQNGISVDRQGIPERKGWCV